MRHFLNVFVILGTFGAVACSSVKNVASKFANKKDHDENTQAISPGSQSTGTLTSAVVTPTATDIASIESKIFLKWSDFDLTKNTKKITESDLLFELSQADHLYDHTSDDTTDDKPDTEQSEEAKACTDFFAGATYAGSKGKLEFNVKNSKTNCTYQGTSNGIVMDFSISFDVKFYMGGTCETTDFTPLNGKTLEEAEAFFKANEAMFDCIGTTMAMITNSETTIEQTVKFTNIGGAPQSTYASRSLSAEMTSKNGACVGKPSGNNHLVEDCVLIDLRSSSSEFNGEKTTEVSGRKFTKQNIIVGTADTDHWYGGGTIDLVFNDWTGTVTYTASNTGGNYSLTNGVKAVTGTLPKYGSIEPTESGKALMLNGSDGAKVLTAKDLVERVHRTKEQLQKQLLEIPRRAQ